MHARLGAKGQPLDHTALRHLIDPAKKRDRCVLRVGVIHVHDDFPFWHSAKTHGIHTANQSSFVEEAECVAVVVAPANATIVGTCFCEE